MRSSSRRGEDEALRISQRKSAAKKKSAIDPARLKLGKEVEALQRQISLGVQKVYEDRIFEQRVEQLRARLLKKEVNEQNNKAVAGKPAGKAKSKPVTQGSNTDAAMLEVDTVREREDLSNVTYDDHGNALTVQQCKVERLPNLSGTRIMAREVGFENAARGKRSAYGARSKPVKPINPVAVATKSSSAMPSGRPPLPSEMPKSAAATATIKDTQSPNDTERGPGPTSANFFNPMDKEGKQFDSCSFNIKENMKAGFGITFYERAHKDQGPQYEDMLKEQNKSKGRSSVKLSTAEYQRLHSRGTAVAQIGQSTLTQLQNDADGRSSQDLTALQMQAVVVGPPEVVSEYVGRHGDMTESYLIDDQRRMGYGTNEYAS